MNETHTSDVTTSWKKSRRLITEISRADIARYAGASGDVNLVHIDEAFAVAAGHRSVLAHGMLSMALTGSYLSSVFGHETVRSFGGRFLSPVFPGESLDCTMTVNSETNMDDNIELTVDLLTTNQDGAAVFAGTAIVVTGAFNMV